MISLIFPSVSIQFRVGERHAHHRVRLCALLPSHTITRHSGPSRRSSAPLCSADFSGCSQSVPRRRATTDYACRCVICLCRLNYFVGLCETSNWSAPRYLTFVSNRVSASVSVRTKRPECESTRENGGQRYIVHCRGSKSFITQEASVFDEGAANKTTESKFRSAFVEFVIRHYDRSFIDLRLITDAYLYLLFHFIQEICLIQTAE